MGLDTPNRDASTPGQSNLKTHPERGPWDPHTPPQEGRGTLDTPLKRGAVGPVTQQGHLHTRTTDISCLSADGATLP